MTSEAKELPDIEASALAVLSASVDLGALEEWRVAYLGRKGKLTQVLRGLGSITDVDERRRLGGEANAVKQRLEAAYDDRRIRLEEARVSHEIEAERLDVTLPGIPMPRGRVHPITQTMRHVPRPFPPMGFQVAEGP